MVKGTVDPFLSLPSMRCIWAVALSVLLVMPAGAQDTPVPAMLNIVIVEGEGVINNVRQRVAREPIVQVEDENHKPVGGALVTFLLPGNGAGGSFANGSNTLTVVTGPDGRATATGLKANNVKGQYQVRVTVSYKGLTASKAIAMSNVAGAAIGATALWTTVLLVGAGAAAGIALGVNSTSGPAPQPTKPPITITPGTPGVTPPR